MSGLFLIIGLIALPVALMLASVTVGLAAIIEADKRLKRIANVWLVLAILAAGFDVWFFWLRF